ncbi:MAG: hypothetical protein ACRD1R_00560 [Acidobacteriota bacterium]
MRLIIGAITLLVSGAILWTIAAALVLGSPSIERSQLELRCEGDGGVIINVAGKDYGVNGKAGPRHPPIQTIWTTVPQAKIDRLIVHGLTLCDWQTAAN